MGSVSSWIIVAAVVVLLLILLQAGLASGSSKFKKKQLLTANEFEFLVRLEMAAPEVRFCPQVSMGALLNPTVSPKDRKQYMSVRGRYAQKIVDFVAQSRASGEILAIIELDDKTHVKSEDATRDAMLTGAGYRVIRWQSKYKPDADTIRSALLPPADPSPL